MQELPFQYYDDRPQGKILVRVVNYVNNVSDMLTNGIINFILEIFNLIFITIFMFSVDARLALVIFAGVPVFIVVMIILKNKQRRAWQGVSNKNSNQTAYLAESINCMRVTQSFARENENLGIFRRLSTAYGKSVDEGGHGKQLCQLLRSTIYERWSIRHCTLSDCSL